MFRPVCMTALPLTFAGEGVISSDAFEFQNPNICYVTADPVPRTNGVHPTTVALPLTPAITFSAPKDLSLEPGEYTVTRRINREERDLTYIIDQVIPTAAGISLLVIDPSKSELISGYDETSFPDEPIGSIPLVGPTLRVKYHKPGKPDQPSTIHDVTDKVHLAARTMLYSLLPLHGGRL